MKLTVIDENLFLESIGYGSNKSYQNNEYEVYATFTYGLFKRRKKYLILIDGFLCWCKSSKAVRVTEEINKDWIFVPKFKRNFNSVNDANEEVVTISYNSLYCYPWMIEDKKFFLNICEDNEKATNLFKEKYHYI